MLSAFMPRPSITVMRLELPENYKWTVKLIILIQGNVVIVDGFTTLHQPIRRIFRVERIHGKSHNPLYEIKEY